MGQAKLSVSSSPSEVAAPDKYAQSVGLGLRSAAIQQAIKLLGDPDLKGAYTTAWQKWENAGRVEAWATTVADRVK